MSLPERSEESTMSKREHERDDDRDPLDPSAQVPSEIPPGLDRRKFIMRSAVISAAAVKKEPEGLALSRARLKATILLPVGSEPGDYEVQILDADLKSRASSTGSATIVDYVTTLQTTLDTSGAAAGKLPTGRGAAG
jgi:hypothetical protein